jgi:hypothetical protein
VGEAVFSRFSRSDVFGTGKITSPGEMRALVRAAVAVTLTSSALLLVSGSASSALPGPADTRVVAPTSVTVPSRPPYEQLALTTLDQVVKGNFAAVSARFDTSVRNQADPEVLAKAWKAYQEQLGFGRYQSHGVPREVVSGHLTVVDIPLRMAKQPGDFRVAFDEKGNIEGMWFLRTGVPVP